MKPLSLQKVHDIEKAASSQALKKVQEAQEAVFPFSLPSMHEIPIILDPYERASPRRR